MSSPPTHKTIKVFGYDYTYLDSGAPESTNYTTWVILHGLGFNGGVFEKLLPLAHAHNLRIVSVNRRGYPPSSDIGEDELNWLGHGKKIDEVGLYCRAQGTEIGTFLATFATEQGIPLADRDSHTGGIVLIGWSLGGQYMLSVLAYADELPEDTRLTLHKYLHTTISHDTNPTVLAIPIPSRQGKNLWKTEPDDQKRLDAFFHWASAHYIHKDVTSKNVEDLEFNDPSEITRSLSEISYDERQKYTSLSAFALSGCDGKLNLCHPTAFAAVIKRALFDKARAEIFPDVRVRYMSSGTSPGMFVWPVWVLGKHAANPEPFCGPGAEKARDVKFVNQTEGNHFVFWENPEKAIQQYNGCINL